MAEVEIYKLKKTVDPAVKDYGMFEFFGAGGPFPQNYVREWAGELPSGDLATILGRSVINPPKGYHGGPLEKGGIIVVDGDAYFLDRESGYKFVDVEFDTSGIKDAVHVDYGYNVVTAGAEAMPSDLAALCVELNIPIGYFSEPDYHGSRKGESSFEPQAIGSSYSVAYLHPQFLRGAEAAAFIDLLSELSRAERQREIREYLIGSYPVYQQDLEKAREQFAPELLLPEELRSLSKVIPIDADKSELAYLAALVVGMGEEDRRVFDAVIDAGWHCGSVADIINLTGNLSRFDIQPVFDPKEYGASYINKAREEYEDFVNKLEQSDPASTENSFFYYFAGVEHNVDLEAYGEFLAELDGGEFTKHGYLTTKSAFQEFYKGPEDIPAEYRVITPPDMGAGELIMVYDTDLPALLLEMHALGGDYMSGAKHNLQTLAAGGTDFLVMMNERVLTVTPADTVFRRDTTMHEVLMMLNNEPDIRTFIMSAMEREDGRVTGNLYEVALEALQHYIRDNSFHFTHFDAEMKNGTKRLISGDEWDAMVHERDQVKSKTKYYDPADESRLATYLNVLRWAVEENRTAITAAKFLSMISETYMARSHEPQRGRFRVTPEAARDIVAQNAADVFKFYPEPFAQMLPIDTAKAGLWTPGKCEFSVRHSDWQGLEKWAQRASTEMLRQTERGEHDKTKNKGEEL